MIVVGNVVMGKFVIGNIVMGNFVVSNLFSVKLQGGG